VTSTYSEIREAKRREVTGTRLEKDTLPGSSNQLLKSAHTSRFFSSGLTTTAFLNYSFRSQAEQVPHTTSHTRKSMSAESSTPKNSTALERMNKDERSILDYVYKHMMDVSFGEEVYGCDFFCRALREEALPQMMETIQLRERNDLDIKVAIAIGMKALEGHISKRMKKVDEMRLCLEAAFIMLVISRPDSAPLLLKTTEEMVTRYPEFITVPEPELRVLISFRNVMVIAMQCISPRYNKNRLLTVVTRIVEGRGKRYVTGSGQTDFTTNRVTIYERESGLSPTPRSKASKHEMHESARSSRNRPKKKKKREQRLGNAEDDEEDDQDEEDEEEEEEEEKGQEAEDETEREKEVDGTEGVDEEAGYYADISAVHSSRPVAPRKKSPNTRVDVRMERQNSQASTASCPDLDFFRVPFLDLYSGEAISPIQDECFSSEKSFFTAASAVSTTSTPAVYLATGSDAAATYLPDSDPSDVEGIDKMEVAGAKLRELLSAEDDGSHRSGSRRNHASLDSSTTPVRPSKSR
jgi:hypothetical protein